MSLRLLSVVLLVMAPLSLPAQQPAAPAARVVVVRAGHMLDGVSAELQGPVSVVVTNGRITAVTPDTSTVAGAEVIDLGDAVLLPGLIDAHKHMGGPPQTGLNTFQVRLTIDAMESAIGAAANARKLLEEGFTTVRSVGSTDGAGLARTC